MSSNMRGGWKVNATEYNRYRSLKDQYNATPEGQAKTNFGIYVVVLTIVLLLIFG